MQTAVPLMESSLPEAEIKGLLETIGQVSLAVARLPPHHPRCFVRLKPV